MAMRVVQAMAQGVKGGKDGLALQNRTCTVPGTCFCVILPYEVVCLLPLRFCHKPLLILESQPFKVNSAPLRSIGKIEIRCLLVLAGFVIFFIEMLATSECTR